MRTLLFVVAASGVPYAASCSSPTTSPPDTRLDDVIFQGSATKAALANIAFLPPTPWDDWGGTFDTPANGEPLSGLSPALFSWRTNQTGNTSCLGSGGTSGAGNDASAGAAGAPDVGAAGALTFLRTPRASSTLTDMLRAFGAERDAHAQSAPFTGEGHFLVFATATNPALVRVFTSNSSYMPNNAAWQKLAATSGKTVTVTITSASFQNDALVGCGPFLGETVRFTVQ